MTTFILKATKEEQQVDEFGDIEDVRVDVLDGGYLIGQIATWGDCIYLSLSQARKLSARIQKDLEESLKDA